MLHIYSLAAVKKNNIYKYNFMINLIHLSIIKKNKIIKHHLFPVK